MTQLLGNGPIPFNPSTRIGFDLAQAGHVELFVHDVRGRRVRRLLSEEREPGRHAVIWDGKDDAGRLLANGIYFYRMVATDFTASRKLVLVR